MVRIFSLLNILLDHAHVKDKIQSCVKDLKIGNLSFIEMELRDRNNWVNLAGKTHIGCTNFKGDFFQIKDTIQPFALRT